MDTIDCNVQDKPTPILRLSSPTGFGLHIASWVPTLWDAWRDGDSHHWWVVSVANDNRAT